MAALTIDGGVATDRETLPGYRGRIGSSSSGGRESFLTGDSGLRTPPDAHNLTPGHGPESACRVYYTCIDMI